VNLIPEGATYLNALYTLLPGILETGHTYILTWGINEVGLDTASGFIANTGLGSTLVFTASEGGYILEGNPDDGLVTAIICLV
jgi:hypothetical protein